MPIVKTELKTYRVDKFCEKCHKGKLRVISSATYISTTSFKHVCQNEECGNVVELTVRFPRIEYEDVIPEYLIKEIVPFTLEKHKNYLTSRQMKVLIWEVDEDKGIYIDTNGRHYLQSGTNVNHNPSSSVAFIPDHIVTPLI